MKKTLKADQLITPAQVGSGFVCGINVWRSMDLIKVGTSHNGTIKRNSKGETYERMSETRKTVNSVRTFRYNGAPIINS